MLTGDVCVVGTVYVGVVPRGDHMDRPKDMKGTDDAIRHGTPRVTNDLEIHGEVQVARSHCFMTDLGTPEERGSIPVQVERRSSALLFT